MSHVGPDPAGFEAGLRREQVAALQATVPGSFATGLALGAILAACLTSIAGRPGPLWWLAVLVAAYAVRAAIWWRVRQRNADGAVDAGDLRACRLNTLVGGLAWLVAGLALLEPGAPERQAYLGLALCGLSAGAVTGKAADLASVRLFIWPALAPVGIVLLLEPQPLSWSLGLVTLLMTLFFDFAAQKASLAFREGVRLRLRDAERTATLERLHGELAAERHRLDSILGAADVAAWELDVERGELRCDERWVEISKAGGAVDPARVPLGKAIELLDPEGAAQWREGLEALAAGRIDRWRAESRLRESPDGAVRWVGDRARVLLRDQHGRALRIAGIRIDATLRQRERENAQALLDRLQKIARQVPGVIYQYQLRPDGSSCFPFSSERMQDIYRVTPEEVREDAGIVFGRLHPDDLQAVTDSIHRSAASLSVWRHQYRVRFGNGDVRWLDGTATPERLPDGSTLWHGFITDITDRKQLELSLQSGERKLRGLFELAPLGIALHDLETGRFMDVNEAFERCTGYARGELLGRSHRELIPAADLDVARARERELREAGHCAPLEVLFLRRDGVLCPVLHSALRIRGDQGRDVVWTIVQDISERKEMERALTAQARTDRLTGLANRLAIIERLEAACAAHAQGRVGFALLLLDFDNFKLVNDTLGHEVGDELLRQVAGRLRKALRAGDSSAPGARGSMVGRLGGDEFVALIEGVGTAADAEAIAGRLLAALAPPHTIRDVEIRSSASIGIVLADGSSGTAGDLLRDADVAMYEAKRAGRACARTFDAAMSAVVERRRRLETDLRGALGRNELRLVYQPVLDLESGRPASVEALLRWQHPEFGAIPPSEFVPVAEDSGLVAPIGEWVLREACCQLAQWRRECGALAPATVAVNVSRLQLGRADSFVESVLRALREAGLEPGALVVEVTEREVIAAEQEMRKALGRLRDLGVRVAVDDFGIGVSSLSCLHEFPVSMIKIDRSFVREIDTRRELAAVVSSVVLLVENLGLSCVAEGIETRAQLGSVQALGCHFGQGYLFSRPLEPEAIPGFFDAGACIAQAAASA
jgi:diguanylate cyclase (GGDEF)-like protein/PAS domain S-box-containing protein